MYSTDLTNDYLNTHIKHCVMKTLIRVVLQLCAPIALFYLNTAGDLMPVAIQMFQHKGADNVVSATAMPNVNDAINLWV